MTVSEVWDDPEEEIQHKSSWSATKNKSKSRLNKNGQETRDESQPNYTCHSMEDNVELAKMEEMGLPCSFNSSKKRTIMAKGEKKGSRMTYLSEVGQLSAYKDTHEIVLEAPKANGGDVFDDMPLGDTVALKLHYSASLERSEHYSANEFATSLEVGVGDISDEVSSGKGNSDVSADSYVSIMTEGDTRLDTYPSNIYFNDNLENSCRAVDVQESDSFLPKLWQQNSTYYGDVKSDQLFAENTDDKSSFSGFVVSSRSSNMTDYVYCGQVGEVTRYLEKVSMCCYYYNWETLQWVDQPEVESLAYSNMSKESYGSADASSSNEHLDEFNGFIINCSETRKNSENVDCYYKNLDHMVFEETRDSSTEDFAKQNPLSFELDKIPTGAWELRTTVSNTSSEVQCEDMPKKYPIGNRKYWLQRWSLFSKFDDGIKMDNESWFSVTPESVAKHHALRCASNGIVVDCFTGVGGNAIQLAKRGHHIIAIDIDPVKIEYAQHNASIYGVDGCIEFIKGDFFTLAPNLKAETVFLSPPWGGPDYSKVRVYPLSMLKPYDGYFLFNIARKIGPVIAMYLPRNVDINQLAELALSADPPMNLEVEKNFLNGKLKAITAYFSDTCDELISRPRMKS